LSDPHHAQGGQGGPEVPPREPTERLFFALWPAEDEREALARAAAKPVRSSGGRPVPAENLHVTLAFLGSVPVRRVPELRTLALATADAFARHEPLALRFERLVHWSQSEILCALGAEEPGAGADPREGELRATEFLAGALKDQAAAAGFTPDLKPFRPHVTVARKVLRAPRERALRHSVLWRCTAFALIASRTHASGAIYSVVEFYPLGKPDKAR